MLSYNGKKAFDYEARRAGSKKWELENAAVESIFPDVKTVLDVPVGTGRFIPFYLGRGIEVTGVDLSMDMLKESEKKGACKLSIGDIRNLNFNDKSFDLAVCIRLTGWLSPADLNAAMSELFRVAHKVIVGIRTADQVSNKGRLWCHDKSHFLNILAENGKSILDERVIKPNSYSVYLCG